MTKADMLRVEENIVREMKRIADEHPQTAQPDLEFKRDWAYGNAGLENDRITREQVDKTIMK
jgi:hypothetical protein